jgi:FkbM family methyltransferase
MSKSRELETRKFLAPWGVGIDVVLREGTNDQSMAQSIIVEDEYFMKTVGRPGRNFIDLGACTGCFSLLAASMSMLGTAVEILPENIEIMRANIALNGVHHSIHVLHKAISNTTGKSIAAHYCDPKTESGRVHEFIGNTNLYPEDFRSGRSIYVETVSLNDILDTMSACHVIKSDCEGAEWEAFDGLTDENLSKITWIVGEIHTVKQGQSYDKFLKLFRDKFVDVSSQFTIVEFHDVKLFALKNKHSF